MEYEVKALIKDTPARGGTLKIDTCPVITHYFELKEFDKALQLAESASTGKIVFNIG